MELLNAITKYGQTEGFKPVFYRYAVENLILVLAPSRLTSEELWCNVLGNEYPFSTRNGLPHDEAALVKDTIEIAVQINGKVSFKTEIPSDADQASVEAAVNADSRLAGALAGRSIVKFILRQRQNRQYSSKMIPGYFI